MKMKNIAFKFTFLITLVGLMYYLNSCYPDYGMSTEDYDMVITRYDTSSDFGYFKYFYISDSIAHVGDGGVIENPPSELTKNDALVIDMLSSQFEAIGYTRIYKKDDVPETELDRVFVVTNTILEVDIEYYYYYWGYWGWYYPYYPYYPPTYGGTYTYTVGTLVSNMNAIMKMESKPDSLMIRPIWVSVINGLTSESSQSNIQSRVKNSIIQAFAQSPYLGYYGDK
jgi:hypothetical protein